MTRNILFPFLLLAVCTASAGAADDRDLLGRVSSVAGEATAQAPGAEPRSLACGDPVYAGDTLRTGADSAVGVMLDDVMTQLSADTHVALGRTDQAMPAVRLEQGKVRMLDPREEGAAAQLAALDARAELVGNDTEGYLFKEKVGAYAMLCEWDAPLPVKRGDEALSAKPGDCVIAKPKEPLYTAKAHEERIPAVAELCEPGPQLALNSPLHHLSPGNVAAPGPIAGLGSAGFGGMNPDAGHNPDYLACDRNAGSCLLPAPLVVIEPGPGPPGPAPGT